MTKTFCSIAASLDGYIGARDGDLSWLNDAMAHGEDYGFAETIERTGVYIMGANTYRDTAGMSGGGDTTPTYVVTHQNTLATSSKHVVPYRGDLRALADEARRKTDKDVYLFGGGNLLTQFIELDLLDELILGTVPVLLGDGVPLFGTLTARKKLTLVSCKHYPSGIVLSRYERR